MTHDRSQGSRHRRFHRYPGHRDLRQARRYGRKRRTRSSRSSRTRRRWTCRRPRRAPSRKSKVKLGDKVSEGSPIVVVETGAAAPAEARETCRRDGAAAPPRRLRRAAPAASRRGRCLQPRPRQRRRRSRAQPAAATAPVDGAAFKAAHASPSVRKFARELGVDLARVTGSAPKGRILQEDVQKFVKQVMSGGARRRGAPAAASAAAARSTCCRGRPSTSRSSVRSKPRRCRGSRRFPARTSRATG